MKTNKVIQGDYISEEQFDKLKKEASESYSDPYFNPTKGEYSDNENDIIHKIILKDIDKDGDIIKNVEIVIIQEELDDSNQQYFVDYLD